MFLTAKFSLIMQLELNWTRFKIPRTTTKSSQGQAIGGETQEGQLTAWISDATTQKFQVGKVLFCVWVKEALYEHVYYEFFVARVLALNL